MPGDNKDQKASDNRSAPATSQVVIHDKRSDRRSSRRQLRKETEEASGSKQPRQSEPLAGPSSSSVGGQQPGPSRQPPSWSNPWLLEGPSSPQDSTILLDGSTQHTQNRDRQEQAEHPDQRLERYFAYDDRPFTSFLLGYSTSEIENSRRRHEDRARLIIEDFDRAFRPRE